jgi:hypothetical protein
MILVCLLVVSLLVASVVVVAKKPPPDPPPPPPAGTIYFQYNDGGGQDMYTMLADGSEKTQLGIPLGIDQAREDFGKISRLEHGGHYWFIRFELVGGHYPNGKLIREIFAVRDDGAVSVQLTDDPTLQAAPASRAIIWGINDETIAWSGYKWVDGEMDMNSFGIYSAGISFDGNGDVVGLTEAPSLIWDTGYWTYDGTIYVANAKRIDYSPDGSEMVLVKWNKQGGSEMTWDIFVVDLVGQTESDLQTTGHRVKWSPDGNKIAILQGRDLVTINPDGTEEEVIVASIIKTKSAKYVDDRIGWSPDSTHLVYTWVEVKYGNNGETYKYSVRRVEANGDNPTSMTDDLPDDTYPSAHFWR